MQSEPTQRTGDDIRKRYALFGGCSAEKHRLEKEVTQNSQKTNLGGRLSNQVWQSEVLRNPAV